MSFVRQFSLCFNIYEEVEGRVIGRSVGLDVHRDFCEVAIAEAGEVRSAGRVQTTPERLELLALAREERDPRGADAPVGGQAADERPVQR